MKASKETQLLVLACAAIMLVICIICMASFSSGSKSSSSEHSFAVYFTEILASNSAYPDANGKCHDYIELYNSANGNIDLSGYTISDTDKTVKHEIPAGTIIAPGQYLVIWCESGGEGEIANFSISKKGGETLYLMNKKNVVVDAVVTLSSEKNFPMILDENNKWTLSNYATPGYPNTAEGYEAYLASRTADSFPVRLSEVLSSNSLYAAPDGVMYDFIELYNPSAYEVDLSGCQLSDDPIEMKYRFPEGTSMAPGSYLLLWCGKEDGLPFKLNSEGNETVCLQSPNCDTIDQVALPALAQDISLAKQADGSWQETEMVTPGYENSEAGYDLWLEVSGLKGSGFVISEVMAENATMLLDGGFPDWIEICNVSDNALSLGGWFLSDNPNNPCKWSMPDITVQPGEYLLILCDGKNTYSGGFYHSNFSLSKYGETVLLTTSACSVACSVELPATDADRSVICDTENPQVTDMVTPGYPNTTDGWLAYQDSLSVPTGLIISEVMSSNDKYLMQSDRSFHDWVEFYNNSDAPINLSDYYLTDKLSDPDRYRLPDKTLESGEYYTVVLTDGTLGLNAIEERIYLYTSDLTCVDCMKLSYIPYQCSYGRMAGENGEWYFSSPTPGKANTNGLRTIAEEPQVSVPGGAYNDVSSLNVSLSGSGNIYYTTDGSWPTVNSRLYSAPIELTSTTVLRAICVQDGCLPSGTASYSYFINEGHTLPILSLTMDPYLFSCMYNSPYAGYEPRSNLTFYETDGTGFTIDCTTEMFGSMSRSDCAKKSFQIKFKPKFGASSLKYPLYDNYDINEFYSLVLRAGQDYTFAMIREELMTSLAKEASSSLLTQNTRPCVLYINGKYWGIYNIKEAFTKDYYATHFGCNPDSVTVIKEYYVYSEAPDLQALKTYGFKHNMNDSSSYAHMCKYIDIESLADWIVFETYCVNSDVRNNVRYAKSDELDGMWRYCFYDCDWTMRGHNTAAVIFNSTDPTSFIARNMVQNSEFKQYLLERLAYHLTTTLSDEHVLAKIDELAAEIRPEMAKERARWGGSVESWESNVTGLKNWVSNPGRAREMANGYSGYFGIGSDRKAALFGGVK